MPSHRVLLLRHGETHGYFDDVGLTEVGEAQARDAGHGLGKELGATLAAGTRIRMPHAPTARATATAATLRAALLEALRELPGERHGLEVGPLEPDGHFDSLQFLHDGVARESSGVAAYRLRLDPAAPRPDWATDYDRFDTDYGAGSRLGGPIDRWMAATTRHFEPPQVVVYRAWAGITALGRDAAPGSVALVSSHSALLRAFAAAAVGQDLGEPANLEQVVVDVHGDTATVTHRGHRVDVEVPTEVPPWIDPAYLHGARGARPL